MSRRLTKWWQSLPGVVQKASQIIAASTAVLATAVGLFNWFEGQVTAATNKRIDELTAHITSIQHSDDLSLKRLELMTLIAHTPDNIAEIERVAYYYFAKLEGDWYMTKIYSDWATMHNGDTSFVRELN